MLLPVSLFLVNGEKFESDSLKFYIERSFTLNAQMYLSATPRY